MNEWMHIVDFFRWCESLFQIQDPQLKALRETLRRNEEYQGAVPEWLPLLGFFEPDRTSEALFEMHFDRFFFHKLDESLVSFPEEQGAGEEESD